MTPDVDPDPLTLKRIFKQRCADTGSVFRNWQIRVHRSLSWSIRARSFGDDQPEAALLFHWIAFNSLYGRWDNIHARPAYDSSERNRFLRRAEGAEPRAFEEFLHRHKPVLKKLLGTPFLSNTFWRNPDAPKAREQATADLFRLDGLLRNGPRARLLEIAFERVYVLRGQLVHGASSSGSRLNRTTLTHCLEWMRSVVPLLQHVTIHRLADDDWPELCYPPVED